MNKYFSMFALAARSTIYKILGIFIIMVVLQLYYFNKTLNFIENYLNIMPLETVIYNNQTIMIDRTKWNVKYGSKNICKKITEHIMADNFDLKVLIIAPLM